MDAGLIIAIGLLIVVGLPFLTALFSSSGALRNALLWVVIFLGMVGIHSNWDSISRGLWQPSVTYAGDVITVAKGADNHFRLTLHINDVPIDFLVDTGATQVVLTQEDARSIGFAEDDLSFIGTASTANGQVRTAPIRLASVRLGDIKDTNVRASVNGGEMEGSLLGMSYLSRFSSIEIRPDTLILTR